MFNFLNAFMLQVACSVASKRRQLSVQACCRSLLPRHEESGVKRSSTLPLCCLNPAFFQTGPGAVSFQKRTEKLASEVSKRETEISFKVRV